MKLLTKINRRYALFSAITLLFGMILIYLFMQHFVQSNLEENLELTELNVKKELSSGHKVEFAPFVEVKEIVIEKNRNIKREIKDTLIDTASKEGLVSFKQLKTIYNIGNKNYLIVVRSSNVEQEDLLYSIVVPVFILLLLILIISNLVVNRISLSIWKPFYKNLEKLKKFSASDKIKLALTKSEINEFNDLNNSLIELTEKVKTDYTKLREFSENASHELQTPIAVMKAKIETMLQNKVDNEGATQLHAIYKALNRLSRLNNSLTLLTKLESVDFEEKKEINLKKFILRMEEDFFEIAEAKEIKIENELSEDIILNINEDLLEILFSNLLVNAIKYNVANGKIILSLDDQKFIIKNTGMALSKDPQKMFDRFEKGDQSYESSGLGLTIVKQICVMNKLSVEYIYINSYHTIKIYFRKD